jgi:RsiW-degrading membrane proteinase PrsW (M82 family)
MWRINRHIFFGIIMPLLASLLFGFAPMFFFAFFIYWLDRYEKEPKVLLTTVFFWGVIVAAGGAFIINTVLGVGVYLFTGSEAATELTSGSLIAPIVEESLKGLAVLIVFFIFRSEFDSTLDGIIYAAIVALGFAAAENSFYIYTKGYLESGWNGFWLLVFVRVVLVGLQHPFYTAFIGIGLAFSRMNKNIAIVLLAPIVGWCVAVFTHALHNTVLEVVPGLGGLAVGALFDWSGWIAMAAFASWALWHEAVYLKKHLSEEVSLGTISSPQYQTAIYASRQTVASINALFSRKYAATVRFYQLCGELAHKKQQLLTVGDENGNGLIIQSLRTELVQLGPDVLTFIPRTMETPRGEPG